MKRLSDFSWIILLKNKGLALSCTLSVGVALLMILGIFSFSTNAMVTYSASLRQAYGDMDMIVTLEGNQVIDESILEAIQKLPTVEGMDTGRWTYLDIDHIQVYAIGLEDDLLNRSRYKYQAKLMEDEAVINQVYADYLGLGVGDLLHYEGISLKILEVLSPQQGATSPYEPNMMLMSLETLDHISGDSRVNYALIKAKGPIKEVVGDISQLHEDVRFTLVEEDPVLMDSIVAFKFFAIGLALMVGFFSVLLVSNHFNRILQKYHHDLAIIRALGGSSRQIKNLLNRLGGSLIGLGLLLGWWMALILNRWILAMLATMVDLKTSQQGFFIGPSIGISLIFGLLIYIGLRVSLWKKMTVMPIEVIKACKPIGKKKGKEKKTSVSWVRTPKSKEWYLARQLLRPKLKENAIMIATISFIIMVALIGSSLTSVLTNNNARYVKSQYLTDTLVTSSVHMDYESAMKLEKDLKGIEGIQAAALMSQLDVEVADTNQEYIGMATDMNALYDLGLLNEGPPRDESMIISKGLADQLELEVGDSLLLWSPKRYKQGPLGLEEDKSFNRDRVSFDIMAIWPNDKLIFRDMVINRGNQAFLPKESLYLETLLVSGQVDLVEGALARLKTQYPFIRWTNKNAILALGTKVITQRFRVFTMILTILVMIAGLGWLNALRMLILGREREYDILRMQGFSPKSIGLIIWLQVFRYLVIGLSLGGLLATLIVTTVLYLDSGVLKVVLNGQMFFGVVIYLLGISGFLIPLVIGISKGPLVGKSYLD